MLWTKLGLSHPLVLGLTHYICGHPLNPMGIHLLHCTHGGEKTTSHNVIRDAFMSIVRDVRFHILQEQTHILRPPSFQFFYQWINIVLLIDSIHTLANVVIVDHIRTDLVSKVAFFRGVVVVVAA